ncbi:TetR/AcrR family transcriptional regulator [Mycobacterium montefiorense]|uniref:TetR family transcriptional regulator n=1 Tax=Mycobacterium montefiorense TaxID=154654 RepID=A0AA37PNU4_9MYCO|nr:TetR family transcriptional regulator [Mycobacterium montefiorense]GBG37741.1 TetR family transcriptional regulator [Mycobacterium montefiorense]GKU34879.1 TetR family transcriptional regulator [Mycobacterium montefiorense]GKU40892.1 TetR family transcriptional regulator [Mycobacterium montefiorense]GKU47001.1 TetR family transcriptional regulator [Mycobacterium montefiorense]GKU49121.1 TetR family transcriptional regulator [Mycobacterium montefiorense]
MPTGARRKHNAPERRRQLTDAAIELLGSDGVHGVSHPKVDERAQVPAGSTSFYFRTRKALLHAVATRLTSLDVADFALMTELAGSQSTQFTGTAGLARIVMHVNTEPWLTRARARCELMLLASRDPELAAKLNESSDRLYALAREVVTQWHPAENPPDSALIEDQALAALTFINGVMMTFVAGQPVVESADHLDQLIQGVITGVALTKREPSR